MRAPRHTRWKGRGLEAHLNIPADARHAFGGKKQFLAVLHTSDPVAAAAKVGPMVKEWKDRIRAVRAGLHDPLRDEIEKLAAEFRSLGPRSTMRVHDWSSMPLPSRFKRSAA